MTPRKYRVVCYEKSGIVDRIMEFHPVRNKDGKFNKSTQDIFNTMLYYDRVEITEIDY